MIARVPFVRTPPKRLRDEQLSFPEAAERVMRREAVSLRAVAAEDRDTFKRFERERSELFKLHDAHGVAVDPKGHVKGDQLGPLTMSIVNAADDAPAVKHFQEHMLAIYAGFSPELESFCTLNLWAGTSDSATVVFHVVRDVAARAPALLTLEGKYQVEPPNAVFPWFARNADATDAPSAFYDWKHFPYAKRNGDELLRFPAPIASRRLHLRSRAGEVFATYGELITITGALERLHGGAVDVLVPRIHPEPGWDRYTIKLGLATARALCEQIARLPAKSALVALIVRDYRGEPTLLGAEPTTDLGMIAHVMARELDRRALMGAGLRAGTMRDVNELLGLCAAAVRRSLFRATAVADHARALALLRASFLDPFFAFDHDGVLAHPRALADRTPRELAEADRVLAAGGHLMAPLNLVSMRRAVRRLLERPEPVVRNFRPVRRSH